MKKLFRKIFLVREIKSKDGVLHFRRWRIISTPWFSIFVHNIYVADKDKHLHDHPWNYTSIILGGEFIEETLHGSTRFKPFMIVSRDAGTFHKASHMIKPVTTLFFTGSRYKDWGYYVDGIWVQNEKYRELKNSGKLEEFEMKFQ